jgi:hypothetical protein
MKAMVMPRNTSSDSRRWMGAGAGEGLVIASFILRFPSFHNSSTGLSKK